jgi:hypothetical protein
LIAPSGLLPPSHSLSQARSPLVALPSLPGSPFLTPTWPTPFPSDVLLKRDYPNVKYWYRQDWVAHVKESGNSTEVTEVIRGKTLASKGINKTMLYIEDVEGKTVDGYKLRDIRAHARAIWTKFQSVGRLPTTWGRADAEIAGVYRREMRSKFFEFALCENDWKADLLATESYPSWYSNHVKGITVKGEAMDSHPMTNLKRPLTMEPPGAFKKAKVSLVSSSDIHQLSKISQVLNPLLTRKLGGISTNPSTGNAGLLAPLTSVAVSPEPILTNSGVIPALVVTHVDNGETGFIDNSNNTPGAEDEIDEAPETGFVDDSNNAPGTEDVDEQGQTPAVSTSALVSTPAVAVASQTEGSDRVTVTAPPAAVPRPNLDSERPPISPALTTAAASAGGATTTTTFSSDILAATTSGAAARTALVPRPIFRSAASASLLSPAGLAEVPQAQATDSAATAAAIPQLAFPPTPPVSLPPSVGLTSTTSTTAVTMMASALSSQIQESAPPMSNLAASVKGTKSGKANQTVTTKKAAKMRPNNSLTPRFVTQPQMSVLLLIASYVL